MGYFEAFQPSMETDIVHGGGPSAPVMYNNTTASISEVTASMSNLTVGFERIGATGASGMVFIDDIMLYRPAASQ